MIFLIVKILKPYWLEFNNVQRYGPLNGLELTENFPRPILALITMIGSRSHFANYLLT